MKVLAIIIGVVFLAGVLVAGCVALVNDDDSLGRIQLIGYHDDEPRCYEDEDCDDYSQRYDQNYGSRDDRNRNRHRNRGAFSPGPFDRSPIEMHDVCISIDCSGRSKEDRRRDDEQPPPDEPQATRSLFPPTPDGIKMFVLSTIQAGIELGRLFADTTITFVENLLFGIA